MRLSGYPLSVPLSHFHPTLSLCTPLPLSLSCPVWVPSSHCPGLSLQHSFPWLAFSAHFPSGPSMAPPHLPLIAQTSRLLSTPRAAAVPAQAHCSPSTQTPFSDSHHTAVLGLSAHQGSDSFESYFIFAATVGQQSGYTYLTDEAPKGKKSP